MALEQRLRQLERKLEHFSLGRHLRTMCILCNGSMPTEAETEAAINDYKAGHPGWDTEDLIEIRVNTRGTDEDSQQA